MKIQKVIKMTNEWPVGTVEFVANNYIEFTATGSDLETRLTEGNLQSIRGINDFVYCKARWDTIVLYRITRARRAGYEKNVDTGYVDTRESVIFSAEPMGVLQNSKFIAGSSFFPMIGDTIFEMSDRLLKIIFSSAGDHLVSLGSVSNYNNVSPDLDLSALLTSHIAILGNTGSGKSTTLRAFIDRLNGVSERLTSLAKFFIFDVHGDYSELTFAKHIDVKTHHLPLSKLKPQDWEAALLPSEKTQRPILNRALRIARVNQTGKKLIYVILAKMAVADITQESFVFLKRSVSKWFNKVIDKTDIASQHLLEQWIQRYSEIKNEQQLLNKLNEILADASHEVQSINDVINYYSDDSTTLDDLEESFEIVFGEEEVQGNRRSRINSETMMARFRSLKSRYGGTDGLLNISHGETLTLKKTLSSKPSDNENDEISNSKFFVLDLTGFDDDALRLVSNYLARSVFDFNLYFDRTKRNEMPFNYLYLDEAHRYVKLSDNTGESTIFEQIAREGRKFNMYLCVISQIPSELSKVVLSQTGAFFIHRIQNSADLDFIRKNVPSATDALVNRLPSLPAGTALLSGNAFKIPFELKVDAGNYGDASSSLSPIIKQDNKSANVN